jgi:hypothetical protein
LASADPSRINPITGIAGCCAHAVSGHAANKSDELTPSHAAAPRSLKAL